MKTFIIVLSLFTSLHSEIFQGITPFMTLPDLRAKFPGALIKDVNAAWENDTNKLYSITGTGIPGTIYVFLNGRFKPCTQDLSYWITYKMTLIDSMLVARDTRIITLIEQAEKNNEKPDIIQNELIPRFVAYVDSQRTKDSLDLIWVEKNIDEANTCIESQATVSSVRWIPDNPVLLSTVISKYGNPSYSGITETFVSFKSWDCGVSILFRSNQILYVDYDFTLKEIMNKPQDLKE